MTMKIRKYRIASLLALYTASEQERMIKELSATLDISEQMFRLYLNVSRDTVQLNLTGDRLQIIADYLKVEMKDLMNTAVAVER